MSTEALQKLLDDYVTGTISPEDKQRLLTLFRDPVLSEEAKVLLLQDLETGRYDSEDIPELRERLHGRLHQLINPSSSLLPAGSVHRVHFLKTAWFKYAAAIIVMFGIGAYFWTTGKKTEQAIANSAKQLQTDIAPGGEKAVLTLADGTKIILDNAANGSLARQGATQVVKLTDGQVAYSVKGASDKDIMWNTLSTPPGGQYQITLPDGTRVWLNAASSITYPAAFVSENREVKMTGEVYFEVAKNKEKPFIVDINGRSAAQVLGTSFNINAYANERAIKTTLLEGSVKVSSVILNPGQQAIVSSSGQQPKITDADLGQILAWKNGLFNFNGLDLHEVMRQLERWYDIKVQYQGRVSNVIFRGEMYRNVNLSDVLEVLQKMGVKFRLEDKTLTVL